MTNEEAIKELQSMCDHLHAHGICDKDSNMLTACKMAISALEQKPCEDAVSREDALKSLIENTDFEGWELSQALEAIEKLPSVTPQPKTGRWVKNDWTPICSCCGKYKYEGIDGSIYDDVWFPNYCPNCGAKMQEVKE
jgi:hypothetical protein